MDKKVWLITGCSSGIGRGIARAALESGDCVALTARKTDMLADLAAEFPEQSLVVKLDVTNPQEMETAVQSTLERFGKIDVLVNNAGYGYRAAIEESEDQEIRRLFEVNVFAPIRLIQLVLPHMRLRKDGMIINITSIGGVRGAIGNGMYSAAKGAMELASGALYKECAPLGIRVLTVEPGAFRTAFYDNLMGTRQSIDDYADTAGKWHIENVTNAANQPGNPEKAGRLIVKLAGMDKLPKRFAMGSDAVHIIEEEYKARLSELRAWVDMSRETDFEP